MVSGFRTSQTGQRETPGRGHDQNKCTLQDDRSAGVRKGPPSDQLGKPVRTGVGLFLGMASSGWGMRVWPVVAWFGLPAILIASLIWAAEPRAPAVGQCLRLWNAPANAQARELVSEEEMRVAVVKGWADDEWEGASVTGDRGCSIYFFEGHEGRWFSYFKGLKGLDGTGGDWGVPDPGFAWRRREIIGLFERANGVVQADGSLQPYRQRTP
jgi:hypothetical protein